jgi:DNA-binding transcriptional ArsR family regulator
MSTRTTREESEILQALNHPTRRIILTELKGGAVRSPVEIATAHTLEIGHVGYHMRTLLKLGAVVLVDERPVRGAVEHFYKATGKVLLPDDVDGLLRKVIDRMRTAEDKAKEKPTQRGRIAIATLQTIGHELSEAGYEV